MPEAKNEVIETLITHLFSGKSRKYSFPTSPATAPLLTVRGVFRRGVEAGGPLIID